MQEHHDEIEALGARPGRPTAGIGQPPGVAIIDTDGIIRYLHRGTTPGDYPQIDEVMTRLRAITP